MKKSPQAFRTISEVAKVLDVPAHVLRFWESRFSQIKPVKRGGGRRYYRPEDVDLIRGIRNLLYVEGLTIKGAQKVLRDKGIKHVVAIGRGEDAQIAEADALWDEPGANDMAEKSAADTSIAAPPVSPVTKRRVTPSSQPDPRQTSLFGDDDLVDDLVKETSSNQAPVETVFDHGEPEVTETAPVAAPAQVSVEDPVMPVAESLPEAEAVADEDVDAKDEVLDQDALRVVFGKLKALRASMEDD